MKIRKCPECRTYTLKEKCKRCKGKTKQAGYKYIRYNSNNSG